MADAQQAVIMSNAPVVTVNQLEELKAQAIAGEDFLEAERLKNLIEQATETTPLLPAEAVISTPVAEAVISTPALVISPTAASPISPVSSGAFIVNQVGRVPFVGAYASPVLQSRYLNPLTNLVDPYVQGGVQRAAPYVDVAVKRATPYVEGVVTRATPYVEKASPYVSGVVTRATPIVEGVSMRVQGFASGVSRAPGQVVSTIRAAPSQAVQTVTPIVQTVASVPGRITRKSIDTATSAVQTVKAAPGMVYQKAINTTQTAATLAQPYVHRGVGIVTPYVESTLTNQRVQSLYQSRIIQGSIEKATPYVTPVVTHPKVQGITSPVIEWARPRSSTD